MPTTTAERYPCMRTFFTSAILLLLFAVSAADAVAAPFFGKKCELRQPDGSFVSAKAWGDEYHQTFEDLDGHTLTRDPVSGFICFAALSKDRAEFLSTGVVANAPGAKPPMDVTPHLRLSKEGTARQAEAVKRRLKDGGRFRAVAAAPAGEPRPAPPSTGSVKGLCLVIDFPDRKGTIPVATVDDFCNKQGYKENGNNGSVMDYFRDMSNKALAYTNYVPAAYYTALNPESYYDNPAEEAGPKAAELITEALNSLLAQGLDFSQFDSNHDGVIDAVNALYAGTPSAGWGMGLWPHSWDLREAGYDFTANGVTARAYQISDMGNALTIGTFCHENGHMLCDFPDLYDYRGTTNGVGMFCLMGYGSYGGKDLDGSNPVAVCAYLKDRAGWEIVTELTASATGLTAEAQQNTTFALRNSARPGESFYIENRMAYGRDQSLPASGLAIWHSDTNGSNSANNRECVLVQADGDWYLERGVNYGDSGDLWGAPSFTECGDTTAPNTNWKNGAYSGLTISAISQTDTAMTFDVVISSSSGGDTHAAFTMTVKGTKGGSTTPAVGTNVVAKLDTVELTATSTTNYTFDGWSVSPSDSVDIDDPTAPSTKLLVLDSCVVTATFKPVFDGLCLGARFTLAGSFIKKPKISAVATKGKTKFNLKILTKNFPASYVTCELEGKPTQGTYNLFVNGRLVDEFTVPRLRTDSLNGLSVFTGYYFGSAPKVGVMYLDPDTEENVFRYLKNVQPYDQMDPDTGKTVFMHPYTRKSSLVMPFEELPRNTWIRISLTNQSGAEVTKAYYVYLYGGSGAPPRAVFYR